MMQPEPDSHTEHLIDAVIDRCERDSAAVLATKFTLLCQEQSYSNIIMALALVLSDLIEDKDEPYRSTMVMAVAHLSLRCSTPPRQPH